MKTIVHSFGTNLNWVEPYAKELGGKFQNNFIVLKKEDNLKNIRYVLDCGDGIVAYYVDTTYHENFRFVNKNQTDDFIGLYFNLTEGECTIVNKNDSYQVGRWKYNFGIIDSKIETEFYVKTGTKAFLLAIFLNRKNLASFNTTLQDFHNLIDSQKATIRFDRITNESHNIINDLRKLKVGGSIFDLNLKGSVHFLLCDFFNKIANNRVLLDTINENDLFSIISSQMFLIETAEDRFPSIEMMAKKANMSKTKFLVLFKKITGLTPNSFFIENKIYRSKELLEEQQFSIAEVSDKCKFTNHSYFAFMFKKYYGVSPRAFAKQL